MRWKRFKYTMRNMVDFVRWIVGLPPARWRRGEMSPDEIRSEDMDPIGASSVEEEYIRWLREIAAQMAEMNEKLTTLHVRLLEEER